MMNYEAATLFFFSFLINNYEAAISNQNYINRYIISLYNSSATHIIHQFQENDKIRFQYSCNFFKTKLKRNIQNRNSKKEKLSISFEPSSKETYQC